MEPKAVDKAKSRARSMRKALAELECCNNINEYMDTWFVFLTTAKSIYNALEQGAKVSAKSRQWFGKKAALRRQDELLQYVFQARNDDEHGIEAVVENVPGGIGIGVNRPGFSESMHIRSFTIDAAGLKLDATSLDGKPILIEHTPDHAKLLPVTNRGRTYHPPSQHIGKRIQNNDPTTVAQLAATYLESMIREAEGLK